MDNRIITKNTLIEEWTDTIQDIVKEVLKYDFEDISFEDLDLDDVEEIVRERLHEAIDGDHDVIYTYYAKKVCEVLDYDIFEDDVITGERANSWSQASYLAIENLINEEININEIIEEQTQDFYSEKA